MDVDVVGAAATDLVESLSATVGGGMGVVWSAGWGGGPEGGEEGLAAFGVQQPVHPDHPRMGEGSMKMGPVASRPES